jgi:hypothetical protein
LVLAIDLLLVFCDDTQKQDKTPNLSRT